jgi:hypothetical protein
LLETDMTGTFTKYIGTGFEPHIKPAIPPKAKLAPGSKIDPVKCGKIPGVWEPKGWEGMYKELLIAPSKPNNLKTFDGWPTKNVVLRGGAFVGIDIDTDHRALAETLRRLAVQYLGAAPVRGRSGSCHSLLVYRLSDGADPVNKQTLSWRMSDDDPPEKKPQHMLEILGQNCNMMVEGIHPSEQPYEYESGRDLYSWGAENLSPIDGSRVAEFVEVARSAIEDAGGSIVSHGSSGTSWRDGPRHEIGDPALLAPSVELAIEALNWIPCEDLDRNDWLKVSVAFKAATGGVDQAHEAYVDWSLNYEPNTDDAIEDMWDSIRDASLEHSRIGWNR